MYKLFFLVSHFLSKQYVVAIRVYNTTYVSIIASDKENSVCESFPQGCFKIKHFYYFAFVEDKQQKNYVYRTRLPCNLKTLNKINANFALIFHTYDD